MNDLMVDLETADRFTDLKPKTMFENHKGQGTFLTLTLPLAALTMLSKRIDQGGAS